MRTSKAKQGPLQERPYYSSKRDRQNLLFAQAARLLLQGGEFLMWFSSAFTALSLGLPSP
jgi:hypothetical protein